MFSSETSKFLFPYSHYSGPIVQCLCHLTLTPIFLCQYLCSLDWNDLFCRWINICVATTFTPIFLFQYLCGLEEPALESLITVGRSSCTRCSPHVPTDTIQSNSSDLLVLVLFLSNFLLPQLHTIPLAPAGNLTWTLTLYSFDLLLILILYLSKYQTKDIAG